MNTIVYKTEQLVSCIVPTLDESDTISYLISSVCQQDYRPIELIIVDGGSKDNTLEIINNHIDNLTDESFSIKLFEESNFGELTSPANARNIGLNSSLGDYIIFMDSDICFINNFTLSTAIFEMDKRDFMLMYFDPLIDTKLEEYISKTRKNDGTFLYRKTLIDGTRFIPTLGFGEDREFNHMLFGNNICYEQNLCTISIGRHYPHTKNELKKQNEWYGRTIVRYLKLTYNTNRMDFIRQSVYVVYNVLMVLFPIFMVASLIISLKLTLYTFSLFFALILMRLFVCGECSITMYLFLVWYSLYSGFFFTKGLISHACKKNNIGRT